MLRVCSFLGLFALAGFASAQEKTLPVGNGELQSLSGLAAKTTLRGAGQLQQLVVTGTYGNGGVRDLTRLVKYRVAHAPIVRVDDRGMATSVANGTTEVTAEFEGKSTKVGVTVEDADREQPINF